MTLTRQQIESALSQVAEPNLGGDLMSAKVVADIRARDGGAEIDLEFPYPAKGIFASIQNSAAEKLQAIEGGKDARINCAIKISARTVQGGVERVAGVKNIIAVSSAKGGVGKSTTAANLALAFSAEGARAAILDADIYGPSAPVMMGVSTRPEADAENKIIPILAHELQVMSIGFLIDEDTPMVWRGPMVTRALQQFLRDTKWDAVDYLVLDMPPGTGDIQLTVAQHAPVTGAVVVTTPQDLALADAQKGIVMFEKVSIPVLGIVENMSVHQCPNCGHLSHIFGEGGARKLCGKFNAELLGELPLDSKIREQADSGMPTVAADPESDIAKIYRRIAIRVGVKIAEKSRDHSAAFPKIVISDT